MPRKPEPILPFRDNGSERGLGLINLGPKSQAWLRELKISFAAEIQQLGPMEVCRRLRNAGHPVSVLMAYALEGAIIGVHWNTIPWETKQWLRAEFAKMKKAKPGAR